MSGEAYDVDTDMMRKVAQDYGLKEDDLRSILEEITDLLERGKTALGDDSAGRAANEAYQAAGTQLHDGLKSLLEGVGAASGGLVAAARNFEEAEHSANENVAKLDKGLNSGEQPPAQ